MDFSKLPFDQIMKQMKNMPDLLAKKQEEMRTAVETGSAGVDELSVKITINGLYEVKKVEIGDGAHAADKAVLEDLIKGAFVNAKQKMDERNKSYLTGGIPGMPNMPDLSGMFGGSNDDKK